METLTPMMKQFHDLKAKHPDALLLFRCGDFYETYGQDAVTASQVLGITLTRRSNGKSATSKATEMAGFPFHALDTYLPRLIRAGFRVAICDQLEDPKLTKKLVKRGITELITPGVTMDDNVLSSRENNFLGAVHFGKSSIGLSARHINRRIPAHRRHSRNHRKTHPKLRTQGNPRDARHKIAIRKSLRNALLRI